MSALVMISALGAIHGMILTGSRVTTRLNSLGAFAWLGKSNPSDNNPAAAIACQTLVPIAAVLLFGTAKGRDTLNLAIATANLPTLPWQRFPGGFELLVAASAPPFWLLFLLTGIALCVLRLRNPSLVRPFTTPLFPIIPIRQHSCSKPAQNTQDG
jgi:amino acid transporter